MSNSTEDEVRSDVKLRTLPRTAYAYPSYVHPEVLSSQANDVFWCLVALRLANALTITTFFQPDEYYQSLEPAWATAFGPNSGAWLTWEWQHQLRSSLHPVLFAIVYYLSSVLSFRFDLPSTLRAELFVAIPKIVQAFLAAISDFFTWKLGNRLYGRSSQVPWAALFLTILSPWQWFFSTRTFSNNLETTFTVVGIYFWPWQWSTQPLDNDAIDTNGLRTYQENDVSNGSSDELAKLRRSLLLAAFACLVRPTNSVIWLCIAVSTLLKASTRERVALLRESAICGLTALALGGLLDRWFYGAWTFPPAQFVNFNIVQSLSTFYGTSRIDYYLTEGLPLALTTALPFAIAGLWQTLGLNKKGLPPNLPGSEASLVKVAQSALRTLAVAACAIPAVLSLLAHKEVRFLSPILPLLHILAAKPLASFYDPFPNSRIGWRKLLLFTTVLLNLLIAGYTSYVHQRGVMDVVHFLRREHQRVLYDMAIEEELNNSKSPNMSVGFLMPCHSTPWRSHLVHSTINAWALTCEPPLDVPPSQRDSYADEADQFYESPERWLEAHLAPPASIRRNDLVPEAGHANLREWPNYLVFFEQLEPVMQKTDASRYYSQCWRGFNTQWHDDWRRRGDVIAWQRDQELDS